VSASDQQRICAGGTLVTRDAVKPCVRGMSRPQRHGPQFLTLDPALHQIAANWPRDHPLPVDLIAFLAPTSTAARPYRKVPFGKRLTPVNGERMPHQSQNDLLLKLGDTNLKRRFTGNDLRNRKVLGPDGTDIGHVSALFLDRAEGRTRFLQVGTGGFLDLGEREFLIPVEDVTRTEPAEVHIHHTREQVLAELHYDPKSVTLRDQAFREAYSGYYGHAPSWTRGK